MRILRNHIPNSAANITLGATVAVLAFMGALSYITIQGFLRNDALVEHTYRVMQSVQAVLSDLKDAETGTRGFMITGDPKFLTPYDQGSQAIDNDLATARELTNDNPRQQQRLALLSELAREKLKLLAGGIELRRRKSLTDILAANRTSRGNDIMIQARGVVADMEADEQRLLALRTKTAEASGKGAQLWTVLGFLLGAVLVAISAIFVFRYVEERRQAEAEVSALNEDLEKRIADRTARLEDANRELEAFSYSVSHDLRAPLRHISGFASMLQKNAGPQLDETSQRHIVTITEAAQHAGHLVDDLLAFSKISRTELQTIDVNMTELLREVRNGFALDEEGRQIEWQIGDLAPVDGDPNMLRLVWQNLIGNAMKYTKNRPLAVIQVGSERQAGETTYYVQDNGAGFDMKYVDKLFGVFQRLHSKEQFEGTGIGLAQVRRIVSRHGGRAWAEGEIDKGARFSFSLPNHNSSE